MNLAALAMLLAACGGGGEEAIPDSGPCVADPVPTGSASCPSICTSCTDGVCHIECSAGSCNDRTITCPADFACAIACNGLDSCDTTVVECPAQYPCNVDCTAYDSCGDMRLMCGKGACSMTCNGPTESCGGSLIDCGTGGDCRASCLGTSGPQMDCRGACGCTPC